jgi:nitrogen-specific signal transduction histidine kinase/ActR/RegA family two-component response regulator
VNAAAFSNPAKREEAQAASETPHPEATHSSRLETVGRLASGVAHDFANILTLISGYTEILLDKNPGVEGRSELEEIRRASRRGATLIAQLLGFARTHTPEPKPLALNTVVTEVERMLRPVIGETIEVKLKLDPSLGKVLADPVELDQLVMNLLLNARDAMPGGGSITVETENSELDPATASSIEMEPGACVMVRFADTGQGIDPEAMQRLFEPFFTTKPLGKGAGLGLSTVRQIVRRRGGAVWAASSPGAGAVFHVCLPRVCAMPELGEPVAAVASSVQGSESVLVVEDENSVRRLLTQILRMRGYQVIEASNGEQALEVFRERGDEIQLVLTDVIMPKMGGGELAQKLLAIRPDLRLVFMSGYPDSQLSGLAELSGCGFLRKPLTPDALSRAVREALDSAPIPFDPQ